ncbi:hypothetical protein MRX96_000565 [Rhipicephalus microplus]
MTYVTPPAALVALGPASPHISYGHHYSVVGSAALIERRAWLPPLGDSRRQEGSLGSAACLRVAMLIAGIVFATGLTVAILAHAKCIDFLKAVHGEAIMVCAAVIGLVAGSLRFYRTYDVNAPARL